MESTVRVESERPDLLADCLSPSLASDENVSYSVSADSEAVEISFSAGKLSHLRGSSDTVFRLVSLSKKIIEN